MLTEFADGRFVADEQIFLDANAANSQQAPVLAALASGGLVATWFDNGTIVAQLHDSSGARIGAEFTVATSTQASSHAIGLAGGGFVIGWTGFDADGRGVKVQMFDSAGTAIGGVITLNQNAADNQQAVTLTALATGGFAAAWQEYDVIFYRAGMEARIFDASGVAVTGDISVAAPAFGNAAPTITALANGNIAIAYVGGTGDLTSTINARVFDPAGNPTGTTFTTTGLTSHTGAGSPRLTLLSSGDIVLVWGGRGEVLAQIFTAAGARVGDTIRVAPSADFNLAVAATDAGFAVAFGKRTGTDPFNSSATQTDIAVQLFDVSGLRLGGEFIINAASQAEQIQPSIVQFGSGDLAIAFTDYGTDSNGDVAYRLLFNSILGTSGNDELSGTSGWDRIDGLEGHDLISGHGGDDILVGGQGHDTINGDDGNDALDGGEGDDLLDGGLGADVMDGGIGHDRYIVDDAGDVVQEAPEAGSYDHIFSSVTYVLPDEVEYLDLTGSTAINGTGNDLANSLTGNLGNNHLSGGAGNDTLHASDGDDTIDGGEGDDVLAGGAGADILRGGSGNDVYYIDSLDTIEEGPDQGTGDGVWADFSYTLGANLESLSFTGTADLDGIGNELLNSMWGNSGNNVFRGLGGRDYLFGWDGNDSLYGGEGDGDELHGGAGDDLLDGGSGSGDWATYGFLATAGVIVDLSISGPQQTVGAGFDTLVGIENLDGTAFNDRLSGNDGANQLAGGGGIDTLEGRGGDDLYFVELGDTVIEQQGGGTDTISSMGSYDLPDHVETLLLARFEPGELIGRGNALDNTIHGSWNHSNTLYGGDGDDTLNGGSADDIFVGGQGNDRINGGGGNDTVDYSQETGPGGVYVNLQPGTVFFQNGDTLGPYQARDTFGTIDTLNGIWTVITGAGADTVLGGEHAERIETGAGNDFLNGGYGADTLVGGSGDDVYFVRQAFGVTIVELAGGGTDEVRTTEASFTLAGIAYVENLRGWSSSGQALAGNELGNRITGHQGDDVLSGAGGNDTLIGDQGNDTLDGGSGDDILQGGLGTDAVSYASATAGVTVNLNLIAAQNTVGAGTDTLSGFEILIGSDYGDRLTAGAGYNIISGGGGNDILVSSADGDRLSGEAGDDLFIGGAGNDEINGGEGFDTADYSLATAGVGANGLVWLISIERAIGSNFADDLRWAGEMIGGAGNDVYSVNSDNWIVEAAGQGVDRVESWGTNYTLSDNVENLSLHFDPYAGVTIAPHGERNGTGNAADNIITGSYGANRLSGLAGADTLTGDGGLDTLTGGTGNDTFRDTAAGLDGDTITDFSADDRIVITNANLAGFTFSLTGNMLTFTGGSLTLGSAVRGSIVASAAAGGGVQLALNGAATSDARNDFNGDGRSDVLWRHASGGLAEWLGQANGGFVANANVANSVGTDWQIAGTADFNGDGREDILWRHTSGSLSEWLGQANGGFVGNANVSNQVGTDWQIAGTDDFNGDGRDDILWRHSSGTVREWLGQANGGFADNANVSRNVGNDWQIADTADFNGDGRADILWRHSTGSLAEWLGQANGDFVGNANVSNQVGIDWKIAGSGDFNGDGRDDILWRHASGAVTDWLGTANGGFVVNGAASHAVTNDWKIAGTGDYNGDGRDDILWRHDNGTVTDWFGTANGSFVGNGNVASYAVSNDWKVQPGDYLLV